MIKLSFRDIEAFIQTAKIRKRGDKWCVLSHKDKSLGCYDTKEEAVTRLRQVEYFKSHKA